MSLRRPTSTPSIETQLPVAVRIGNFEITILMQVTVPTTPTPRADGGDPWQPVAERLAAAVAEAIQRRLTDPKFFRDRPIKPEDPEGDGFREWLQDCVRRAMR